jgi:hypothetical protein
LNLILDEYQGLYLLGNISLADCKELHFKRNQDECGALVRNAKSGSGSPSSATLFE